ncbi:hypothetical protein HanPI659440_Chr09g0349111 [Helianthus annuus]|nr:hypothetical protein HanPI659440_Chr09g0349111 [Helianthus annuus]
MSVVPVPKIVKAGYQYRNIRYGTVRYLKVKFGILPVPYRIGTGTEKISTGNSILAGTSIQYQMPIPSVTSWCCTGTLPLLECCPTPYGAGQFAK